MEKVTITGLQLTSDEPRDIEVEFADRNLVLHIEKQGVRIDRHTLPTLIQALQAAALEAV